MDPNTFNSDPDQAKNFNLDPVPDPGKVYFGTKVYTNCVQDNYFPYQISELTQLTSDFFILSLSVYGNRSLSKNFSYRMWPF